LISNPLDPSVWSDTIADEIDIDFAWLDNPDYSDEFVRARERLTATMEHHVETQGPREVNRIVEEVCAKHGIAAEDETDPAVQKKIRWEISRRLAAHALGLPYVEDIPGEEIVARLKAASTKSGDEN